jgi:hypothetical protein
LTRRKDRERFESMKKLNPDYAGFRGHSREPDRPGNTPLQTVTCSVCGRKRNVAVGVAQEQGEAYVCQSCQEAAHREEPEQAEVSAGDPAGD